MTDLAAVIAALERAVREGEPATLPTLIGDLERVKAVAWSRLAVQLAGSAVPRPDEAAAALLTVRQVAEHLGVPEQYVRELIRRADLPALRIGRYHRIAPADLTRWEAAQRIAPPPVLRRIGRGTLDRGIFPGHTPGRDQRGVS